MAVVTTYYNLPFLLRPYVKWLIATQTVSYSEDIYKQFEKLTITSHCEIANCKLANSPPTYTEVATWMLVLLRQRSFVESAPLQSSTNQELLMHPPTNIRFNSCFDEIDDLKESNPTL